MESNFGLKCVKNVLILLAIACCVVIIIAIVTIPISKHLIRQQIASNIVIKNGSQVYDMWQKPTIPIYFQVYVFDLQNPKDVINGARPALKERGPYTYHEHREKVDIVAHENGTVSYRQLRYFVFDQSQSIGSEQDTFTTINIPLMAMVQDLDWLPAYIKVFFQKYLQYEEPVFRTLTIYDIVWGYQDPVLHLAKAFDKNYFYTDIVGAMAGKNGSDDGYYTVFTGATDISLIGKVDQYNGSKYLPYWSTPYANMVNGTDGTLIHPFVEKTDVIYLFSTDVCRSALVTYNDTVTVQGIEVYQFTAPPSVFESAQQNPDNAGFCTPAGNCLGSGVLNISSCQIVDHFNIPLVVSFPHFYLADPAYLNQTTGLHPDPAQHNLHLDIEPLTGVVVGGQRRVQINVNVVPTKHVRDMRYIPNMIYPVLWINESAQLDDGTAGMVRDQLRLIHLMFMVQHVCVAAASVCLIVVSLLSFCLCCSAHKGQGQGKEAKASNAHQRASEGGDELEADERSPLLRSAPPTTAIDTLSG